MAADRRKPLARLVWLDPFSGDMRERALHEGESLRIGRSADNDIQLPEAHISRAHAIIACQAGKFTIDDVGSANGSFVNGIQIYGKHALNIGDEVLLFVSALKLLGADDAAEDVMKLVAKVAGDRASLRIVRGPQAGQVFALLNDEIYVGRSMPSANWEVALQDPTVSRPHAFMALEGLRWKLFDLGSVNGTAVNGEPIIGGKATWLEDGDRITFGGTLCQFSSGFPISADTEPSA
ncbi:MAG: FHA domain-containing protein [Chloroflexi bacterium]|nr:FHA domain-containing protein [Chloroflexota bacterium]MCY3583345.1 FHA domain-containing protein [Chloroflexota bacterium]MXX50455.1 FHA domain-containing protein [Chloroflexota bacterium]MXX84487.1 FHA domain-containing protein [Chloroflexota bacterium]MYA92566.1 FHA domain-containing protein [Chloroflexota bacterium]